MDGLMLLGSYFDEMSQYNTNRTQHFYIANVD